MNKTSFIRPIEGHCSKRKRQKLKRGEDKSCSLIEDLDDSFCRALEKSWHRFKLAEYGIDITINLIS